MMGSRKERISREKSAGFCFVLAEAKWSHPVTAVTGAWQWSRWPHRHAMSAHWACFIYCGWLWNTGLYVTFLRTAIVILIISVEAVVFICGVETGMLEKSGVSRKALGRFYWAIRFVCWYWLFLLSFEICYWKHLILYRDCICDMSCFLSGDVLWHIWNPLVFYCTLQCLPTRLEIS